MELPLRLGGSVELRGYPLPMVHAEKIVTALSRGSANTLARAHPIDAAALARSIATVGSHRQVTLAALADVLDGHAGLA